jgi:NAD(P)-dependent dehydrogenase (short-subunit alcohol dehydrogenase family)
MGLCAARCLAGHGVRVAALDVDEEALNRLERERPLVAASAVDVADARAVESVVADVEDRMGAIVFVMNAAGIMPTGLLLDQDAATVARVMEVNYGGTVNVTLAAVPRMVERGEGEVVNFAALAGWIPGLALGAYAAANFAVVAFTEVLAHENRDSGVGFVCVCPPAVRTPMLERTRGSPRGLARSEPLDPVSVLSSVERALEGGRLFAFPGWRAAAAFRLRRFAPGLLWAIDHWAEET